MWCQFDPNGKKLVYLKYKLVMLKLLSKYFLMPQSWPISWAILYLLFIFAFLLIILLTYFIIKPSIKTSFETANLHKTHFNWTW